MNLTLALPSLNRQKDETLSPLQLPAFNQILRYGLLHKQEMKPSDFYRRHLWKGSLLAQIKEMSGIPPHQAAAFASPIWQQMGLHQVSVVSGEHLQITKEEAARLCLELSEFYSKEGWHFLPVRPDLWLITLPSESDWGIAPALDIYGQIGSADQADGKDALQWLGMQTEMQMWLHQHPLNAVRTQNDTPTINGLWLWQDLTGLRSADFVASDSIWAQFSDNPRLDAPYDFQAWLDAVDESGIHPANPVIFLDDLAVTEQTGDIQTYQEILESWETRWFAPLWQAVSQGRLKNLSISTDGENGGTLRITPFSKWKFWHPKKTFTGKW